MPRRVWVNGRGVFQGTSLHAGPGLLGQSADGETVASDVNLTPNFQNDLPGRPIK